MADSKNSQTEYKNGNTAVKRSDLRRGKGYKPAIVAVAIVCGVLGWMVFNHFALSGDTFLESSTINGVDVSGLNAEEAKEKVTDAWNDRTITITEDGKEVGSISDLDLQYDIDGKIDRCLHPDVARESLRLFSKKFRNHNIKMEPVGTTTAFDNKVNELDIVAKDPGTIDSEDAYVDMSNREFNIVTEVYGDKIDPEKVRDALLESVSDPDGIFEFDREQYLKLPTILANDESLAEKQEYCKKHLNFSIKLRCPLGTYELTPADIDSMVKYDDEGNATVDEEAVRAFVEKLAKEQDSVGAERTLLSADGTTKYKVQGGTYGSSIDVEKETQMLIQNLKDGKDVERAAEVVESIYGSGKVNDIGDSYIEVNLAQQRTFCVIDGKVVLDTPIVSGNLAEMHGTPSGIWPLGYKCRDVVLKGKNNDGTTYENFVSYWMQVVGGIGLHDATWRYYFGGDIFRYAGSHGCINMPPSAAAKLYELSEEGMPVIIHW